MEIKENFIICFHTFILFAIFNNCITVDLVISVLSTKTHVESTSNYKVAKKQSTYSPNDCNGFNKYSDMEIVSASMAMTNFDISTIQITLGNGHTK